MPEGTPVPCRMDIEVEFLDIISQNGYMPEVEGIHIQEEKADAYIAEKLQVPEHTEVMKICRVCTADGRPAIYCEDMFAKDMIKEELFRFAKFTGSSLIGGTVDMVLVWLLSRYVFKGY